MEAFFKGIDSILERIEKSILILLFSALIILMSTNIVQRNLLGQSSQTILEYLPTMVMWISLIGASLALRQGRHISMELVLRFVPGPITKNLHRLSGAFGAAVMLLCLYLSFDFMAGEIKIFGPRGYISIIVPVFFAIASFRYIMQIFFPPVEHK